MRSQPDAGWQACFGFTDEELKRSSHHNFGVALRFTLYAP
jgi:hypothetical protein